MDDAALFRALFETTYGAVRRYVHHRGVPAGRADDIVAETYLVAWRRFDQVPRDDPLPWLIAVARNHWRNDRRSRTRHANLLHRLPAPLPVPPPDEPPEPGADGAVFAALAALDDGDRELLLLVAWDGLTPAQAAQVLDCNAGAARVRLHRARRRFAAELAQRSPSTGQDPDEATDEEVRHGT